MGCLRWGIGFLDEGQGLLRARGSREVRPGPSFGPRPCTTTPSGDCWWAFCMSGRSSWMYAPGSRFSPCTVVRWSVLLSARYELHVWPWFAAAAACSTCWMLSRSGSLSRSIGSWFAGMSRPLGGDSGGGLGGWAGVDICEWVSIAVLDVPLDTDSGASCVWFSGARGCADFLASGDVCGSGLEALFGRRSAAPHVEVCGSGPCFGRCTPCGLGSRYADTVWCLWFGSWFGRCSPCVVMGCGPVPGPAIAVLSALRLPSVHGTRFCRPSRISGRFAFGSLRRCVGILPAVLCRRCVWA